MVVGWDMQTTSYALLERNVSGRGADLMSQQHGEGCCSWRIRARQGMLSVVEESGGKSQDFGSGLALERLLFVGSLKDVDSSQDGRPSLHKT